MASNTLSTKAAICDAALALLRQDVGYAANSTVAAKCDNVWYVAWDALRNAHGWQTPLGAPSDTPPADTTQRALLVYAVARELAIPITGRQEDLKTVSALFSQKVREAAAADMAAAASALQDTTLGASLVAVTFAAARDANAVLPTSTPAFLTAGANEKAAAESEVRATLGLAQNTALDALAKRAVDELVMSRLGATCCLSEQYAQLHSQLYAARIAEWRKIKLNAALAANSDPILAQLLANFKSDDAGLVNAIEVYTNRFAAIASSSEREVRSQYDLWEDASNTTGTVDDETFRFIAATYSLATNQLTLEWAHSQHWFPAYESLVKAKLALVMGHDAQAVAAFDAEYRTKLGLGLKIELDEKLNAYAVEATTGNRSAILYQLLPNFKTDDTSLLHTFAVYDRRAVAVDEQSSATIRDLLGLPAETALAGSALEASIALSAAKLAPVVGLDASIVKVMTDRYLQIVEQAKKDTLDNIVTAADQTAEPFKSCMDEVKKTLGITATPVNDPLAVAAAKELTAANHGEAYGYDANYAAKRLAEYHRKIIQWRKVTLDAARASDDILAQLVGSFKGDDEALANAWASYETRKGSVLTICQNLAKKDFEQTALDDASTAAANILAVAKLAPGFGLDTSFTKAQYEEYDRILTEHKQRQFTAQADSQASTLFQSCLDEVKRLLDITGTTADPVVLGAASALCYVRNGARARFDANVIAIKKQEYDAKILEYRKLQLDTAMKSNSDPILAQLVANFKGDDTSLVNAFAAYTSRVAAVKANSEATVKDLLNVTTLTGATLDAAIALSVAKLAQSCGMDANTVATAMKQYEDILADCRKSAFDAEIAARSSTRYTACVNEVKKTLGIAANETPDALAYAAADHLCRARFGVRSGYDANFQQAEQNAYEAAVAQWRKVKLDEWLATNSDPILAQLVANFKADDPGLLNVQTVYLQRISDVKPTSEATVKDLLGVTSLAGISQEAADCLSVAKLAPACGLDANFCQLKMAEYDGIVRECKRRELERFCENRSGVFAECEAEVCKTLGIASIGTDALALGCATALCQGRHGERYGYDTNYAQVKMQEYAAKVLQWRKVALDEAMKTNADPVLALLVSNFSGDDNALVNAFASYTNRIATVKDTVRDAILARHHWSFARKTAVFSGTKPADCIRVSDVIDASGKSVEWSVAGNAVTAATGAATLVYTASCDTATWPAVVKSAYVAAVAAEIAQTVAGNPQTAVQIKAHLDQLAAKRLEEAAVADLNENGSGSEIVREVKNVLKAEFHLGDADLDESATALAERIAGNLEAARLEVLAAHNWNFARITMQVAACETPDHAFAFTRPTDALRISSVRSHNDRILGYTIDGTNVVCSEMPHSVTYVSDMPEPDDFPPLVRRALVYRLASDVAVSLPQRKGDPSVLIGLYKEKLAAAATTDARESNPGRNAWGRGSYVSSMRGQSPRERAHYPFHR